MAPAPTAASVKATISGSAIVQYSEAEIFSPKGIVRVSGKTCRLSMSGTVRTSSNRATNPTSSPMCEPTAAKSIEIPEYTKKTGTNKPLPMASTLSIKRWPWSAGMMWRRMKPAAKAASTASRLRTAAKARRTASSATVARRVGCELLSALSRRNRERAEPHSRARLPWTATSTQKPINPSKTATFAAIERLGESNSDIATTGQISPMAP